MAVTLRPVKRFRQCYHSLMRIASLLASATEIVYELGLGDQLVAISHECDYPPDALRKPRLSRPRFDPQGMTSGEIDAAVRHAMAHFGSVYEIDAALLQRLQPDLVLSQAVCEVCAVPTSLAQTVADMMGKRPRVLSIDSHSISDIIDSIQDVAAAAGVPERGEMIAAAQRLRLDTVTARVAGAPRQRVLAVEWLDPPFVPGHWMPEMIEIAGGLDLFGTPGRPSQQLDWQDLSGTDPDVLVIMPCGYGLDASRADADRHAERLIRIAPRAIETGRAFVVDGSAYFNRSGPRMATGVEILGALLHPSRFPEYEIGGKAAAWNPEPVMTSRQ